MYLDGLRKTQIIIIMLDHQGVYMQNLSKPIKIISVVLASVGVILFVVNIILGWTLNIALPLVFLVLGCGFLMVTYRWKTDWKWAPWLFVPAMLLIAFGMIFLMNILTGDWKSWAYAWLLLISGIGVGMILANREKTWHSAISISGWGMALAGITFFVVFGAITGGILIQVMAPILLLMAGFAIRFLPGDSFPRSPARKPSLHRKPDQIADSYPGEQLSSREVEVLVLIGRGLSNQQIALKCSIAPSTVKTHINNIYNKLGVQTRVQALNRARDLGLLISD